jgi:lipopolysaccharide export LptBFGC system permease protein LptF
MRFLARMPLWAWLVAITALCYATYNPTGHSLLAVVLDQRVVLPMRLLVLVVLLVIFGLIAAATYRSIGLVGIVIGLALWGLLIWLAVAYVNLDWHSPQLWTWLAPFIAATLLTLGLRGSTIWRTLTGQVTVDTEQ